MKSLELDVVATRGAEIESRHRVHAAVVGADDTLVASAHSPQLVSSWRSCAKPFQVMPLLESGGFDALRWGDDQLALACASHGGEPEHVAIAEACCTTSGMEEGDLACGPHDPLSTRGMKLLRESGARLTRTHNNCSGKHAAMLARAQTAGWQTYGYERREHHVQRCCLERDRRVGGDGRSRHRPGGRRMRRRGVRASAREHGARLVAPRACASRDGDEIPSRIVHAMRTRPFLIGGTDRFDSVLIEETDGRAIAKIGAEGVHSVGDPGAGHWLRGEGRRRRAAGSVPAVLRVLQLLDVLPESLPTRLEEFLRRPVRNTRGEIVGEIRLSA